MLLESSEDSSLLHQPPERDSIREDLPKKMDIFNGICHDGGARGGDRVPLRFFFLNLFLSKKTILNHSLTAKTCFAHLFSDTPLDYIWRAQI